MTLEVLHGLTFYHLQPARFKFYSATHKRASQCEMKRLVNYEEHILKYRLTPYIFGHRDSE